MDRRSSRYSSLSAHSCHGLHHVIALLLAAAVGAQPLLGQLQRALEGGGGADLQQLDHAALVGRKAHNLADHFANQGHASELLALAVRRFWLQLPSGDDESLVQACSRAGDTNMQLPKICDMYTHIICTYTSTHTALHM